MDEMITTLLPKYLPPMKVSKLQSDIVIFNQLDDESIHDAWKRYKVLLNKASNHGLPLWLEIQFFYKGNQPNTTMIIDVVAYGALMSKARELIDEMSSNHYLWQSTRGLIKKIIGVHEMDTLSAIQAPLLAIITKRLGVATHVANW